MNLKLGCDPEIFLADANGVLRASCGKVGGSKLQPRELPLGPGYAVQEDNVAIEFNIPAAANAKEFRESITKTLNFLTDSMKALYDYKLVNMSAASFPKEELLSDAAKEFGCDPDYNVWTGQRNPKPKATDETLRSCGGHVHVGMDLSHLSRDAANSFSQDVIKAMDFYLGVPSVLMDKGDLRKQLYGKAGAFRFKSYGVEYRTLGNFWIFNEQLCNWVWENTEKAVKAVESQFAFDDYKDSILDAINNNNKETAAALVKHHGLEVLSV